MRSRISSSLGGNILCIDWDERMLRVVDAVIARSGIKVRAAVHVTIPGDVEIHDAEAFGKFIKRSLAEHRIRSRRAVVNVPRQDAVLNLLSLPYGSADELASMVHIQTAKELPFSKDEAVLDFAIARLADSNLCEVWVSAVRNQIIDHFRRVMVAAGLRLERIGLRPYANLVALTVDAPTEGRTLVVDVGPSMTEISVIRQGRLAYSRAASVSVPASGLVEGRDESGASDDDTAPDESSEHVLSMQAFEHRRSALDALLVEVGRTVEAYRATDPGATIDRIVLAGLAGLDRSITQAFERRFHASAETYRPSERMNWKTTDEASQALFSVCIGLALGNMREGVDHFDFLHPTEPEAERRERAKRVPWIAAAAVALVILAGYGAYWPIGNARAQQAELESQVKKLEGNKRERKTFNEHHADLAEWEETSVEMVDHLLWLKPAFPSNEQGFITKLTFDDKGTIDLELAVKDKSVAIELAKRINDIERDGKKLFVATTGKTTERQGDPHYQFKDEMQIRVLSVTE